MRRKSDAARLSAHEKQALVIDGIFKPLERHGFQPSRRSVRRILAVLGQTIGDHELNRILQPWIKAKNKPRTASRAQTHGIGNFRTALKKSRTGSRAQMHRFEKTAHQSPDLPLRPRYNSTLSLAERGDDPVLNDEAEAARAAARAEAFRIARERLASLMRPQP